MVEEFVPYFKLKYPETEEKQTNKELESILIERNLIKDNEYDLVYKSKVKFDYQEDGNYNSQIMRFLNYVMQLSNY